MASAAVYRPTRAEKSKVMSIETLVRLVGEKLIPMELDSKYAMLVGFDSASIDEDGDLDFPASDVHKSGDIYDLLESDEVAEIVSLYKYVAVLTSGWAAPIGETDEHKDKSYKPSEHPQRRRVGLCIVADPWNVGSLLKFSDNNEFIYDDGQAKGALADAVKNLFARS